MRAVECFLQCKRPSDTEDLEVEFTAHVFSLTAQSFDGLDYWMSVP